MADEVQQAYKKCIICGRYSPEGTMIVGQYCSEACAALYKRCPHCGNYFMLVESADQVFCSSDCQNADKIHSEEMIKRDDL